MIKTYKYRYAKDEYLSVYAYNKKTADKLIKEFCDKVKRVKDYEYIGVSKSQRKLTDRIKGMSNKELYQEQLNAINIIGGKCD